MATGIIKRLERTKGYGFITSVEHGDVFFHRSALRGILFDMLRERDSVAFDLDPNDSRGPRAAVVAPVRR